MIFCIIGQGCSGFYCSWNRFVNSFYKNLTKKFLNDLIWYCKLFKNLLRPFNNAWWQACTKARNLLNLAINNHRKLHLIDSAFKSIHWQTLLFYYDSSLITVIAPLFANKSAPIHNDPFWISNTKLAWQKSNRHNRRPSINSPSRRGIVRISALECHSWNNNSPFAVNPIAYSLSERFLLISRWTKVKSK